MACKAHSRLVILLSILFIPTLLCLPFGLDLRSFTQHVPSLESRQVGQGVNGNQTGNSGSVTSGGTGDGNGVGFAGIGNDIDTGDDFDIGDGNNTIGDGNTIEIGDRITEVTNINVGSGNSSGISVGPGNIGRNSTGSTSEMSININLRIMVEDGRITVGVA
ncbi:hypothetical protein CSOJ01_10403 [Colletotrichum sojae]|uniref:Uncharacterized protein n=1 Tax=Colletotrichum sojae TaxID=2175907 RepID=A0A8H6MPH1_9PEZI|nr:hypothetical protein CSOJ01_10403 [Colletotrichum sojae]